VVAEPHDAAGLEPLIAQRVADAVATWPQVRLDEAVFARAIADRLCGEDPRRALEAMHTSDLYLACGCAIGDRAALAGFEERCGAMLARTIATTPVPVAERADLGQVVRQRLLVPSADGGLPRIATYSAQAALTTWVRIVATREAIRMLPRAGRAAADDDDKMMGLVTGGDDPEVGYLKRLYREEFKRAFHAAVEALDDRDRLVLQQHALDRINIDQLARMHGVHRATAARWIQSAREAVVAGTHRELCKRLRLSRSEVASVIRLIHSELEVSLSRALRPPA
jgi:RNA polymerase sigma-70 factor, ECF subfamily